MSTTFMDFFNERNIEHTGAKGHKGESDDCVVNATKMFEDLKEKKKKVEYVSGEIRIDGKWQPHDWVLLSNKPYDPTYGKNNEYKYRGKLLPK